LNKPVTSSAFFPIKHERAKETKQTHQYSLSLSRFHINELKHSDTKIRKRLEKEEKNAGISIIQSNKLHH
jgi:hypothetical protein